MLSCITLNREEREKKVDSMVVAELTKPKPARMPEQFVYRNSVREFAARFTDFARQDRLPPSPELLHSATNGTWVGAAKAALNAELREIAVLYRNGLRSGEEVMAAEARICRAGLAMYLLDLSDQLKGAVRKDGKAFMPVNSADVARQELGKLLTGFFTRDREAIFRGYFDIEGAVVTGAKQYGITVQSLQGALDSGYYAKAAGAVNRINGV